MGKKDGRRFYEEIQIRGLSDESIEECIARYFDNQPEATAERCQPQAISNNPLTAVPTTCEGAQPGTTATPIPSSTGKGSQLRTTNEHSSQAKQESQDLINDVKNRGIYGFLKIPLLLLMLNILYLETKSLPERRTDIIWEIIQMYIKRAEVKGDPIKDPNELLCHLGKLSYDASQRGTHRLMIKKVCKILEGDLFEFVFLAMKAGHVVLCTTKMLAAALKM